MALSILNGFDLLLSFFAVKIQLIEAILVAELVGGR